MTITRDDFEQWSHDLAQLRNYIRGSDFDAAIELASQVADEAEEKQESEVSTVVDDLREIEKLTVERRWSSVIDEIVEVRDALDETVEIVEHVSDE